jgi:hypothetical protein
MQGDRSRYGLLVSALGAVLLAVSVFLPWYSLSFTTSGIAAAQRAGEQAASQLGDPTLQSYLQPLRANLSSFAGVQFASVSAHQVLHYMSVVLLVLAALALLDALFPLVSTDAVPEGAGGALAVLGTVAAAFVLYRMIERPSPAGEYVALSLREGAWLALVGSLAMVAGGLSPRFSSAAPQGASPQPPFSGLSGWTPQG